MLKCLPHFCKQVAGTSVAAIDCVSTCCDHKLKCVPACHRPRASGRHSIQSDLLRELDFPERARCQTTWDRKYCHVSPLAPVTSRTTQLRPVRESGAEDGSALDLPGTSQPFPPRLLAGRSSGPGQVADLNAAEPDLAGVLLQPYSARGPLHPRHYLLALGD